VVEVSIPAELARVSAGAPGPEPNGDDSNRTWPSLALAGAAAAGSILLVAADLTAVVVIRADGVQRAHALGHAQHSWALVVLGVGALVLALAAGLGGSRPAMAGLVLVGLVVLAVALLGDLPDFGRTGAVAGTAAEAVAHPGPGFVLELVGAGLLVLTGLSGPAVLGRR
jgi:peptidoglycan/LPS O-acetylase OafA/YrhL